MRHRRGGSPHTDNLLAMSASSLTLESSHKRIGRYIKQMRNPHHKTVSVQNGVQDAVQGLRRAERQHDTPPEVMEWEVRTA